MNSFKPTETFVVAHATSYTPFLYLQRALPSAQNPDTEPQSVYWYYKPQTASLRSPAGLATIA